VDELLAGPAPNIRLAARRASWRSDLPSFYGLGIISPYERLVFAGDQQNAANSIKIPLSTKAVGASSAERTGGRFSH
jgi:hypothetical protein